RGVADHGGEPRTGFGGDLVEGVEMADAGLGQVLVERAAADHVEDLHAPAHGQRRQAQDEDRAQHGEVEQVLLGVVGFGARVRTLPVVGRVEVRAAGHDHPGERGEPPRQAVQGPPGAAVQHQRLTPGLEHRVTHGLGRHGRREPQAGDLAGAATDHGDRGTDGHRSPSATKGYGRDGIHSAQAAASRPSATIRPRAASIAATASGRSLATPMPHRLPVSTVNASSKSGCSPSGTNTTSSSTTASTSPDLSAASMSPNTSSESPPNGTVSAPSNVSASAMLVLPAIAATRRPARSPADLTGSPRRTSTDSWNTA